MTGVTARSSGSPYSSDMMFSRKQTKYASLFVMAFLCLNVGGALCLTYCGHLARANSAKTDDSHLSDHCRRAKKEAEEKNQNSSISVDEASCCMMPVSLFPAPVEKSRGFSVVLVESVPAPEFEFSTPAFLHISSTITPVYRPPPLDRRIERLRNCVIRI